MTEKAKTGVETQTQQETLASQVVDSSLEILGKKIENLSNEEKKDKAVSIMENVIEQLGTVGYSFDQFKLGFNDILKLVGTEIPVDQILKEITNDDSIITIKLFFEKHMTAEQFEIYNQLKIEERIEADRKKAAMEAEQNFNLSYRQRDALRGIKEIGTMVSEFDLEEGTDEEKKVKILKRVKAQVSVAFMDWVDANQPAIQSAHAKIDKEKNLNQIAENTTYRGEQIKLHGTAGLQNIKELGGRALQFFTGQMGYVPMAKNGLLNACFDPEKQAQITEKLFGDEGQNLDYSKYQGEAEGVVDELFKDKSFAEIKCHFRSLNPKQAEKGKINMDSKIVYEKLLTVGKSWRGGDFEKEYIEYIQTTGPDAYDFNQWLDSLPPEEQPPQITKIIHWFKDMFGDMWEKVTNFWEGKDDDKKDKTPEQLIGTKALEYKIMAGLHDKVDLEADHGEKTEQEKKDKEAAQEDFDELELLLEKNSVDGDLNIKFEKIALDRTKVSAENKDDLQSVRSLMETLDKNGKIQALSLFTKGLELSDLAFLGDHYGDENDDGINVEFGDDCFEMNKDLSALVDETVAEWTLGVGGTAVALLKLKKYWKEAKTLRSISKASGWGVITAIGLWAAGKVVGEYDAWGGEKVKYTDDPSKISQLIKEQQTNLESVKKMIIEELDGVSTEDSVTVEDLNKVRNSSAFQEFVDVVGGDFIGNYKIKSEDIEAFVALKGKDKEGGFDASWLNSVLDTFHEETIDEGDKYVDSDGNEQTATEDIEGFEVNGTGAGWGNLTFGIGAEDMKFIDVEGFFNWLKIKKQANESGKPEEPSA